ncbi:PAAR domain-containing protein [Paraburkholderia caffeinilytica]|uniref:PAAR domain-containing protein n=1 Tax=Paraburkholderia caffeinilytica TaxID=1761016 RepID=UPI003DA008CD
MTEEGCVVTGASGPATLDGKRLARVGDVCSCGTHPGATCTIAEGSDLLTLGGSQVAFAGDHTSCGAALMSSVTAVAVR